MRHEDNSFSTMLAGIFDGGECADDSLVVGDFLVGVKWNVEIHLGVSQLSKFLCRSVKEGCTLIRTRLPLRSTSVIASLLDNDMAKVLD